MPTPSETAAAFKSVRTDARAQELADAAVHKMRNGEDDEAGESFLQKHELHDVTAAELARTYSSAAFPGYQLVKRWEAEKFQ